MILLLVQIVLFLVGLVFTIELVSAPRWQQEVRFAIFMFASFAAAVCAPMLKGLLP